MNDARFIKNPLWYKDGIIYQVHIKAYRDINNDGIGDIPGLIEKLDYIKSLGINILWLLPFYPSPLRDDGYDISDYLNINPDYGSIDDFRKFLKEAHKRKIRVITELVLNHTSDQHYWFKRARLSPPDSPERNFYVWSNSPDKYKEARIIFNDFESANWTWDPVAKAYYWHRFYYHQPDLNFENPLVHKAMFKVIDFWFDLGVDGLRLDAVPYLYEEEGTNCENLPATHKLLKKIRAYTDQKFPGRMLIAEANQWPEDAVSYFGEGDECHMAFHFPLMPRIYMSVQMEIRYPIIDILEQTPPIPENCQWAMFLRNHDELTLEMVTDEERDYMYRYFAKDSKAKINLGIRRRLAPLMENNRRKIELINILLFSFPGTPIIYYGDEIGMGDNYHLGDRNGVRTPMQWSPDRNAGFSSANSQKLFLPVIIDPEYHYETINADVQERSTSSLLWWMKKSIALRKKYKAFGRGSLNFLNPKNPKVLSFIRKFENEVILVVANLSSYSQAVELDLREFAGYIPVEIFSRNKFPFISDSLYILTLSPYDYYWFSLEKQKSGQHHEERVIPVYTIKNSIKKFMRTGIGLLFEEGILADYLEHNSIAQNFQSIEMTDIIFLSDDYTSSFMLIKINYTDKPSGLLLQPLKISPVKESRFMLHSRANEVIVNLKSDNEEYLLYNGIYDGTFRKEIPGALFLKKNLAGTSGELSVSASRKLHYTPAEISGWDSSIFKETPRDYSIQYSDKLFIKIYRMPEEGVQPGEELLRFFQNNTSYRNVPFLDGVINFYSKEKKSLTAGIINKFIPNQGTAWHYFSDALTGYFDKIISGSHNETEKKNFPSSFLAFDDDIKNENNFCGMVDPVYLRSASLLGVRTGEMHNVLSSAKENIDFEPEPFTALYCRSVYQTVRSSIKNATRNLSDNRELFNIPDIEKLILKENILLRFAEEIVFKKIIADKLRIHGDFHLGQILFTGKDFIITNFEGNFNQAISERRLKRNPFRDVTSMLWSFYFAAYQGLAKYRSPGIAADKNLDFFARHWWFCMSRSFLNSYFLTIGNAGFIPSDRETVEYLLMFYLLDRALTELNTILDKSPDILDIPVSFILYLTERIENP